MDKQYFVNVVNLETGKIFSLPTLYTDRVEACVCGQNYVRDRQQENHDDVFYRVLVAKDGKVAEPSYFTVVDDEDEDNEEPEQGESVYEDTEEPSSNSFAEILSVFNAIRPNY